MKKLIAIIPVLLLSCFAIGQDDVEMADAMRENGKIYVVVAVLCVVFAGIVAYLIMIDRKVGKLERELKK